MAMWNAWLLGDMEKAVGSTVTPLPGGDPVKVEFVISSPFVLTGAELVCGESLAYSYALPRAKSVLPGDIVRVDFETGQIQMRRRAEEQPSAAPYNPDDDRRAEAKKRKASDAARVRSRYRSLKAMEDRFWANMVEEDTRLDDRLREGFALMSESYNDDEDGRVWS